MRAFGALWDEITRDRYGVTDAEAAPLPLRRAGQLARPDRGAAGEQHPAHRAGDARRDAVPRRPRPRRAAAGLERGAGPAPALGPAVVAADAAGAGVRVGPAGVPGPVRRLARGDGAGRRRSSAGARAELDKVLELGGVVAAVETGYLKSALVASLAERRRRMESGADVVVGVNRFTETEPSPLTAAGAERDRAGRPGRRGGRRRRRTPVARRPGHGGRRRGAGPAARGRRDHRPT